MDTQNRTQREIKFRGRTLSGKWVYGLLAHDERGWFISNSAGKPFAYYTDGAYRLFSTDNQNIDLLDMANINSKIVGNIYENPELLGTKSDIAVDIGFKEATNE